MWKKNTTACSQSLWRDLDTRTSGFRSLMETLHRSVGKPYFIRAASNGNWWTQRSCTVKNLHGCSLVTDDMAASERHIAYFGIVSVRVIIIRFCARGTDPCKTYLQLLQSTLHHRDGKPAPFGSATDVARSTGTFVSQKPDLILNCRLTNCWSNSHTSLTFLSLSQFLSCLLFLFLVNIVSSSSRHCRGSACRSYILKMRLVSPTSDKQRRVNATVTSFDSHKNDEKTVGTEDKRFRKERHVFFSRDRVVYDPISFQLSFATYFGHYSKA